MSLKLQMEESSNFEKENLSLSTLAITRVHEQDDAIESFLLVIHFFFFIYLLKKKSFLFFIFFFFFLWLIMIVFLLFLIYILSFGSHLIITAPKNDIFMQNQLQRLKNEEVSLRFFFKTLFPCVFNLDFFFRFHCFLFSLST